MSRYLVTTQETWRVDTESEAQNVINEAKADNTFVLAKFSSTYKERKAKGEVIDSWYKVVLTKAFTDEKEPDCQTSVSYASQGFFPEVTDDEEEEF